jgi:hypothetical protein
MVGLKIIPNNVRKTSQIVIFHQISEFLKKF